MSDETPKDDPVLHEEASAYANARRAESVEYRRRMQLVPHTYYAREELWVAHYEAYRDGVKAARNSDGTPVHDTLGRARRALNWNDVFTMTKAKR